VTVRLAGIVGLSALLAASHASGRDRAFSAADLPLVMTAYVEAAIDMRAAYETCAAADKRPADWERGSALLIASLKASGLSDGVAAALEARLAAPVVPTTADCASEQVMLYSGMRAGASWPDYHRNVLDLNGIKIVEPGVEDARLAAVRAVVAEALPKQRRMLVCISLFDPQNFLAAFSDWNGLVGRAEQSLAAAGFGVDIYRPILEGASAGALFAPPPDRAATAADCIADQDWYDRFSIFAWYTFASDVEAALKGGQP
jgi:hypothetical protein